jgi:hypothetical protein
VGGGVQTRGVAEVGGTGVLRGVCRLSARTTGHLREEVGFPSAFAYKHTTFGSSLSAHRE